MVAVSFIGGGNRAIGIRQSIILKNTFNHRMFKTDFKFEEYFNILD